MSLNFDNFPWVGNLFQKVGAVCVDLKPMTEGAIKFVGNHVVDLMPNADAHEELAEEEAKAETRAEAEVVEAKAEAKAETKADAKTQAKAVFPKRIVPHLTKPVKAETRAEPKAEATEKLKAKATAKAKAVSPKHIVPHLIDPTKAEAKAKRRTEATAETKAVSPKHIVPVKAEAESEPKAGATAETKAVFWRHLVPTEAEAESKPGAKATAETEAVSPEHIVPHPMDPVQAEAMSQNQNAGLGNNIKIVLIGVDQTRADKGVKESLLEADAAAALKNQPGYESSTRVGLCFPSFSVEESNPFPCGELYDSWEAKIDSELFAAFLEDGHENASTTESLSSAEEFGFCPGKEVSSEVTLASEAIDANLENASENESELDESISHENDAKCLKEGHENVSRTESSSYAEDLELCTEKSDANEAKIAFDLDTDCGNASHENDSRTMSSSHGEELELCSEKNDSCHATLASEPIDGNLENAPETKTPSTCDQNAFETVLTCLAEKSGPLFGGKNGICEATGSGKPFDENHDHTSDNVHVAEIMSIPFSRPTSSAISCEDSVMEAGAISCNSDTSDVETLGTKDVVCINGASGSTLKDCCQFIQSEIGQSDDSSDDTTSPGMETIELHDMVKLDENCSHVDDTYLYALSHRRRKYRSYKKKIQDALCARRRIVKDYEKLGIWYGDIDTGTNHGTGEVILPHVLRSHLMSKKSVTDDFSDSDWELI